MAKGDKSDKNYRILGIAGIVFVLFLIIAYFVLFNNSFLFKPRVPGGEPPNISGTGLDTSVNPTVAKEMQESSDVMSLLNKLPYYGKNFAFFYSYEGNYFTLYVNPSNQAAGNAEFTLFLKENGIENKSSIYDLRVVDVIPTPQP